MPKERHIRQRLRESSSDESNHSSKAGSSREASPVATSRGARRSVKKERDRKHRHRSRSRDRERERRRPSPALTYERRKRRSRSRERDRERRRRKSRSRSRSRSPSRRKEKERRSHKSDRSETRDKSDNKPSSSRTSPQPPSSQQSKDGGEKSTKKEDSSSRRTDEAKSESTKKASSQNGKASEGKEKKMSDSSVEAAMAAQLKIEEEMRKRRERMEAWRQKRQKEEEEEAAKAKDEEEEQDGEGGEGGSAGEEGENGQKKGWTLEDDEEDDEENVVMEMEENGDVPDDKGANEEAPEEKKVEEEEVMEEEVDPLDAFMVGVQEEVKKITMDTHKKSGAQLSTGKHGAATVITVTKVKNVGPERNTVTVNEKGELLHNNQDAMEYSEEEDNVTEELALALRSIAKKSKKKDLPVVDHRKVEYPPFRKDFYVEVPELAKMTNEEVVAYRNELEKIKVKGKECPKPVKTWAQCGLSTKILEVMKKSKYEHPTPIQAQAIPAIMSGRDLIGIAKTGSGKTLSFVLPMLRHVLDQPPLDYKDGPIAVILTPTRELAIQIYNECKKFCKPLKLHTICVYGGTGISEQIADLKRGAEIVVCTPGRMIDMLAANSGRVTNFRRTTYVVLDEADRMFDMGFEPQVMRIIGNIRPDKQTVMFSATFPRQMEALARKILIKPVEVQVGGRSVVCKDVEQSVIVIEDHQKFFKLLELLGIYQEKGSVLIFVERQETADQILRDLMKSSYACLALHGGMDQFDRDSTIADFKNGNIKILVATSVAARGLDVKQLVLVVNYDCPNHYEDYVHRCGRTGRAGNKGNAYTFITPEQQRYSGDIMKALELSGASVPSELEELWNKYTEKLKAEGKIKSDVKLKPGLRRKKKMLAIGFGGKGFKFDEAEAARDAESKLKQKSSLGLADSDDEDQFALLTMDKKLESIFSNRVQVKDPNAPLIPVVQANSKPGLLPTPPPSERLDLAMQIASNIMSAKNLAPTQMIAGGAGTSLAAQEAASSVMKGGEVQVTGAMLASQIAASINKKVGATPAKASDTFLPLGTIVPGQDSASGAELKYSDEIEINDFPQQIRFRITTREVLDDIGEYSEAYITVRGIYIPESRQPVEGERRLFLSIEAKSERAVTLAKQEIKRVIKEEAQRMASRVSRHQHSGRYSVL